jgi:hypothetical protein
VKLTLIAAAIAAAGLTAGVVAENLTDDDVETATVATALVLDCPAGDTIDSYSSGSRVFAVARSDDATWVQVRQLDFPDSLVWIAAGDVDLDDDIDALPIAECGEFDSVVIAAETSTTTTIPASTTTSIPDSTTTTVAGTTTSSSGTTGSTNRPPPPPTTTTSTVGPTVPTSPPDTTSPVIAQPSATPGEIWEQDSPSLPCGAVPRTSTIRAIVTDNVSVSSVTASWTIEGSTTIRPMTPSGNLFTTTFGPFPYLTIPDNTVQNVIVTIRAVDGSGNDASVTRTVILNSSGTCFQ